MKNIRWREAAALFIFSVFLSVTLIEAIFYTFPIFQNDVRFIAEGMDKDPYYFSTFKELDVWYTSADMTRYRVDLNSIGDGYYVRDDPPEEVYGIAIGDSFTYCAEINIEDCWVNQLEGLTDREFLNLGGPGQFSVTEDRILREKGIVFEPEIVIWQFMTNDISDTAFFKFNDTIPPFYEVRKFLNGKSNTYLLGKRLYNALFKPDLAPLSFEIDGKLNTFNNIRESLNTNAFCNSNTSREVKDAILKSRDATESAGAEFVIVMVPMKEEVYIDQLNGHLGTSYDFGCPIREIKEFAESERIKYIDMTEHLKVSTKDGAPYLEIGGHLSPEGNMLVAKVVFDLLN